MADPLSCGSFYTRIPLRLIGFTQGLMTSSDKLNDGEHARSLSKPFLKTVEITRPLGS